MTALSTTAEARAMLVSMLQPEATPALTTEEVERLLSMALVPDFLGVTPDYLPEWRGEYLWNLGTRISPTSRFGWSFVVTQAGTSGTEEPVWTADENETYTDGTVVWARSLRAPYTLTWNLPKAAAEGWEWKASKVVANFDVQAGKVKATRSQVFEMCKQQAAHFRSLAGATGGSATIGWIALDTTH
jgi:hypothetical protein